MNYNFSEDLQLVKQILNTTREKIAENIGVSQMTLNRWVGNKNNPDEDSIEKFYRYAYKKGINLNKINAQLYKEDYINENNVILFHGAKSEIIGELSLNKSKGINDFGNGFYCGESLEQSATFVSGYPKSSIYFLKFNNKNLKFYKFNVDQEWMLAIAYFRDTLGDLKKHPIVLNIINKLADVDYIIAPIVDNNMFMIMDSFIAGEITDQQCMHSLSATNLGYQYVFVSNKALKNIEILRRGYLSSSEKSDYLKRRNENNEDSNNKVKAAKIKYREMGHYIEEILS